MMEMNFGEKINCGEGVNVVGLSVKEQEEEKGRSLYQEQSQTAEIIQFANQFQSRAEAVQQNTQPFAVNRSDIPCKKPKFP